MVILFKSCPKCSGTRTSEEDQDGRYITCLSCGHLAYPDTPVPLTLETEQREGYRLARQAPLPDEERDGDESSEAPWADPLPGNVERQREHLRTRIETLMSWGGLGRKTDRNGRAGRGPARLPSP